MEENIVTFIPNMRIHIGVEIKNKETNECRIVCCIQYGSSKEETILKVWDKENNNFGIVPYDVFEAWWELTGNKIGITRTPIWRGEGSNFGKCIVCNGSLPDDFCRPPHYCSHECSWKHQDQQEDQALELLPIFWKPYIKPE